MLLLGVMIAWVALAPIPHTHRDRSPSSATGCRLPLFRATAGALVACSVKLSIYDWIE